jgi:hypothetical protein
MIMPLNVEPPLKIKKAEDFSPAFKAILELLN